MPKRNRSTGVTGTVGQEDQEHRREILVHSECIRQIIVLPDGDNFISSSHDKTLRCHSVSSGECRGIFEGHTGCVRQIALLEEDFLISTGKDKTVRLWRISDSSLQHTIKVEQEARTATSMGLGFFLIGLTCGRLFQYKWIPGTEPKCVNSIEAHKDRINDVVLWNKYFVTSSSDGTVKVWDSQTFKRMETFTEHTSPITAVAASDDFIVTGQCDKKILCYDAKLLKLIRTIDIDCVSNWSIHLVGNDYPAILSSTANSVYIHDIASGELLWRTEFQSFPTCTVPLPRGRLISGLYAGAAIVFSPPRHISSRITFRPNPKSNYSQMLTPLQDGFMDCMEGIQPAAHYCETLISPEACASSFEEFRFAHRLLILAVMDGDIARSPHYKGEKYRWYEKVYIRLKDIPLLSGDQLTKAKNLLLEARAYGLIDECQSVLGAVHVTSDLGRVLAQIDQRQEYDLERVMKLTARFEKLKRTFRNYKTCHKISSLVSIALQMIPIVGGAITCGLSVGADVIAGFSVKDFLETICTPAQEPTSSFVDHIFNRAAKDIHPDRVRGLKSDQRQILEKGVTSCGTDLLELRTLFIGHISAGDRWQCETQYLGPDAFPGDTPESIGKNGGICRSGSAPNITLTQPIHGPLRTAVRVQDIRSRLISSSLRNERDFVAGQLREKVKKLSQSELANWMASFIVHPDDSRGKEFDTISDCLFRVLVEQRITSQLITEPMFVPPQELFTFVIDALTQEPSLSVGLGYRARARRLAFLGTIPAEEAEFFK